VEKLLALKLVDHEWAQYKAHRAWTPQGSATFRKAVGHAEPLYTAAEARNGAMADNLINQLGSGPSVLVTGGFHTNSIAHILKEHRIAFAVVTPLVDRLDQDELYVRSLTEPPHETIAALDAGYETTH